MASSTSAGLTAKRLVLTTRGSSSGAARSDGLSFLAMTGRSMWATMRSLWRRICRSNFSATRSMEE